MNGPTKFELIDERGQHLLFIKNGGTIPAPGDIVQFTEGGSMQITQRRWLVDLESATKPPRLFLTCKKLLAAQDLVPSPAAAKVPKPKVSLRQLADKASNKR